MENKLKLKDIILLIAIPLALLIVGIIFDCYFLEIISVIIGIVGSLFNMFRKNYGFFFFAANALLYGYLSYKNGMYGEAILNIFYNFPVYVYTLLTIYVIKHHNLKDDRIHTIHRNELVVMCVVIPVVTVGYGFGLRALNSQLPFLNSLGTALALATAYLASRKKKEQWIGWMAYDLVCIYIWVYNYFIAKNGGGLMYLVLDVIYVFINLNGMISWYKLNKLQNPKEHFTKPYYDEDVEEKVLD